MHPFATVENAPPLGAAGCPDTPLIGIGATRYTPFGESTSLTVGDESIVVVYDASVTDASAVPAGVAGAGGTACRRLRCCGRL